MIIILVDPLPPTPLHLPAKKNQKRYREAKHACEPSISPANQLRRWKRLVHLPDEGVDVLLTVTKVTTLDVVLELASAEATSGVGELEGPEEVGGLLEVGADGVDLVDQVLHADNAVLGKVLLDDGVVGEGNTLLVDLGVSALVDELADGLQVGVTVGDERLDDLEHLRGGLGQTDEDTVVDLEKTEELESLALLGVDLVDTLDAGNEDELGLGGNIVAALSLGDASKTDLLTLVVAVLLDVGLGALEDLLTLGLGLLLAGLTLGSLVGSLLLSGLALLEKGLRDQDLVLGRDATVENVLVGPQGACHEGSLAPSEELRRSGLALMHSPLSTCVLPVCDQWSTAAVLGFPKHECPFSYCLTF